MANDSFILYQRYETQIMKLTLKERGELLTAIFEYNGGGKPELGSGRAAMAFDFITEQMDHDREKYDKRCKKNAENIARRWAAKSDAAKQDSGDEKAQRNRIDENTNVYDCIRPNTSVYETIPNDTNAYLSDSDSYSESYSYSGSPNERESARAHAREGEKPEKLEAARNEERAFGTYMNVRLSDGDLERLRRELPDNSGEYIDRLSEYMRSTGKSYSDHCATILRWAREDRSRAPDGQTPNEGRTDAQPAQSSFDTDDFFELALRRSYEKAGRIIQEAGPPPDDETK